MDNHYPARPPRITNVFRKFDPPLYFITFCSFDRHPILANDKFFAHFVEHMNRKSSCGIVCGEYVIMPDHIHLFCSPVGLEYPPLKTWVTYWKSLSARTWPDKKAGKVWQRDFWDTQLRKGESYTEKWHYVVNNPVRAGLVEEALKWPYQGEICELQWHE